MTKPKKRFYAWKPAKHRIWTLLMDGTAYFPPGPTEVPRQLYRVGFGYRLRAAAMIGGLFTFLVLYLALIALASVIAFNLLMLPFDDVGITGIIFAVVVKFGGALAAGLFAAFLVKGLFKGQRIERAELVPLDEDDHPQFFAFVRRVYQDTRSAAPRNFYVSAHVNASVIYNSSLVNLVFPPKKDLLIGLGLVNVVNLTEFKAVLAYEFGHFPQRSGGFISYLYVADRVMYDIIYKRDALDRLVDQWCELDVRISFPGWGLKAALAGVQRVLGGLYRGLNMLHLSLRRQMEFHADNVAIRLTGSDALIHGLARMGFAEECLADAALSLSAAADHGLFTDDLFYHQARAAERLRQVRGNPHLGLPPDSSSDSPDEVWVFRPERDGVPEELQTHPSNYARECNAKRVFVDGPRDDRSPWILFTDDATLRRRVTEHFYQTALRREEWYSPRSAAEVQAFIDSEHTEMTYDARYHGWYDKRLINPGDVELPPLKPWAVHRITAWLAGWPPPDLDRRVARLHELQEDEDVFRAIRSGQKTIEGRTFDYCGRQYSLREVPGLLARIEAELDQAVRQFHDLDRQAFEAHWSLAVHLDGFDGGARVGDVHGRYRFHMAVQRLLGVLFGAEVQFQQIVSVISRHPNLEEGDLMDATAILHAIQESLTAAETDARRIKSPAFTNVSEGTPLSDLIGDRSPSPFGVYIDGITQEYLKRLGGRLGGMVERLRRVHFKSLGGLLACQERLAKEWLEMAMAPA